MPRWQFVLDAVMAAAFAVVLVGLMAARNQGSWLSVVCLLALALALRRRHVWLMIGLAVLAGLVQLLLTDVVYLADAAHVRTPSCSSPRFSRAVVGSRLRPGWPRGPSSRWARLWSCWTVGRRATSNG
ncbi:DUF7134 domain-containing protein [Nocardioides endophyticus]|uniref:DUF7134 domain-containing protein n=1 Tax=Nocardioides endophyticus TaxID=1353775 RepID=UPI003CD0AAD8